MQMARGTIAFALISVLALTGCGNKDKIPQLMNIKSTTTGPDEFTVLPTKPLQAPQDYASLPAPTPGGSNITDPTPDMDAVAALGGRGSLLTRNGTMGSDGGLVTHAARFGVTTGIRATLASEDLEYRRRHNGKLLERMMNVNVYAREYRPMALDRYRELRRLRRAGVRTPSAPPEDSAIQ